MEIDYATGTNGECSREQDEARKRGRVWGFRENRVNENVSKCVCIMEDNKKVKG
jgi:hypothetical protein